MTDVWQSNAQPGDVTYVYYGAVPGFRYQLGLVGGFDPLAPLWYRECWGGLSLDSCVTDGVVYGRWIRSQSVEEKKQSIVSSLGGLPDRLWLVFSHVYPDEDNAIVTALSGDCRTQMDHHAENARAVLLTCADLQTSP